jgi:hypothetical protein
VILLILSENFREESPEILTSEFQNGVRCCTSNSAGGTLVSNLVAEFIFLF